MATNVVRAGCALILTVFTVGVGLLVAELHRTGMARLRAYNDRLHHRDPHTVWIRALARPTRGGRP